MTKPRLKKHNAQCRESSGLYDCLDCSQTFEWGSPELDAHKSCISEAEKYQGKLYAGNKAKKRKKKRPRQEQEQEREVKPIATVSVALTDTVLFHCCNDLGKKKIRVSAVCDAVLQSDLLKDALEKAIRAQLEEMNKQNSIVYKR